MTVTSRFCTYFDANYLTRAIALHRSLSRLRTGFTLTALCLDDASATTLERLRLPGLEPLRLAELEAAHPELLEARANRSRVEYYFTCTPHLILHLLERTPPGDSLMYLDADLYFFSDPGPIERELEGHSILIVGHRFPPARRGLEEHGVYNVGLLGFVHDPNAIECLTWWSARCIEWCYDRVEPERFADQKYLDQWPSRFAGVRVLEHRGSGVAPWNVEYHPVTAREGRVFVDQAPLVFYHFHGLRRLAPRVYESGLAGYGVPMTRALRSLVYEPYLRELRDAERWLDRAAPDHGARSGSVRAPRRRYVMLAKGLLRRSLLLAERRSSN